jgi:hypothetical protein
MAEAVVVETMALQERVDLEEAEEGQTASEQQETRGTAVALH